MRTLIRLFRAGLVAFCLVFAAPAMAKAPATPPRLVVIIAIDQFGAGLFEQYRARFSAGLGRMASEGVVYPNGYQSHAATETCPGHSTMTTGRHPAGTGIIANAWYDDTLGRDIYCVEDAAQPVAGRPGQGRGPANLRVATLGEWIKAAYPRARVFGVSGKDRAAIMMTGHDPDGVFWWDDENGFTTSVPAGTTAADRLAPVADYNRRLAERWAKTPPRWAIADRRCLPGVPAATRRYGGVSLTESLPPGGWTAPTDGSGFRDDPAFKKWFRASPELDRITLDLAAGLVERFDLGRGAAPDLLTISLSATDYVGHRYGNQGPEMCDQLAHVDAMLGAFLAKLEARGIAPLVVLTADHGALDAAERVSERGVPATRFTMGRIAKDAGAAIRARFALDFEPLAGDGQDVFLSSWIAPAQRDAIRDATIALLRARPEVEAVFTRDEVRAAMPPRGKPADELSVIERYAESSDPVRSGDLIVVPKPFASLTDPENPGDAIATHGSPWNYDRRVPILFWRPGIAGFEQSLPVETVDIAPTIAAILGVATPEVDGRCLDLDRGAASSCVAPGR